MTEYRLYDRISTVDHDFGTIKFIGQFPPHHSWSNTLVYGIEWDNPARGKNDGSVDGKPYFTVDVAGAGSFLKYNNKRINHQRFSFIHVLLNEYYNVGTYHERNITFGTKTVEELGFEKLNRIQSDFRNLSSVSLNGKSIFTSFGSVDDDKKVYVFEDLQNVTYLDISFNLFNELCSIYDIISRLSKLESLNLNGNRFTNPSLDHSLLSFNHSNLSTLKLNSTRVSIDQLSQLVFRNFSNLKQIYLSNNNFNDGDIANLSIPIHVKLIDLSFNKITKLSLHKFSSIETLLISDNQINSLGDNGINNSIKVVDLRYNQIEAWNTLDQLSIQLPNLTNIRISDNPVFHSDADNQTEDQMVENMFIQIIARFETEDHKKGSGTKLSMINGSALLDQEIRNAELYFISKFKSSTSAIQTEYVISNPQRWSNLLNKHDINDTVEPIQPADSNKIQLRFNNNDDLTFTRTVLLNTTILKLKGLISRAYLHNLSILNFNLYYYYYQGEGENDQLKEYLDTNVFSQINEFNLTNNQTVYIEMP